ncbi:MAG: hypothetical protein WC870_02970 [Candidatus Paceibacterota bacterium]
MGYPVGGNVLKKQLTLVCQQEGGDMRKTIVHVDRSRRPIYPEKMRVVHRNLELTGPKEYNLHGQVEFWLHKEQKAETIVQGATIFSELEDRKELKLCLGLADGLAILEKDHSALHWLFKGRTLHLWKSVVKDLTAENDFLVPCLLEKGTRMGLHWKHLRYYLTTNDVALRFKSLHL